MGLFDIQKKNGTPAAPANVSVKADGGNEDAAIATVEKFFQVSL